MLQVSGSEHFIGWVIGLIGHDGQGTNVTRAICIGCEVHKVCEGRVQRVQRRGRSSDLYGLRPLLKSLDAVQILV